MRALDRKLLRDLWRIRTQALAIALVIASGTALFVMSLSAQHSLQETQNAYYERYRFADVFAHVKRAPEALAARIARIPGVKAVATRIVSNVSLDLPKMSEPINGLLVSVPDSGRPRLNDLHLRRGRNIAAGAVDEVVLNEAFAEAQGIGLGDSLWATINGHKRRLTVVGIALSPEYVFFGTPGTLVPDDRRFGVLWMGRKALAAAFDLDGAFNDVTVSLLRAADEAEVIARLNALLERYGGDAAAGRRDQVSHATLSGEIEQLKANIRVASPIFLGVVAFLLHMVISRHVATEREQIGVLKAFGYGSGAIAVHYLKLVVAVVALGVLTGSVAGVWLGRIVTELYGRNYHFPFLYHRLTPGIFVEAAAVQLAAAVFGTLGSLLRAARLPPAVAMQPPPPPVYRKTSIERLVFRLVAGQPTRMILRHIVRWPVRAALTVFGIAAATAVLVAPMAVLNAAQRMVEVHFFQAERQDLTVAFVEPRPRRALIEAGHMPGVLRAEPFRAVPARLEAGPRERRVIILGIEPGAELSRRLDGHQQPLALPPQGVVLSTALARWLGVAAGDRVTVAALEGRRPVRQVPVAAVAESHVGLTIYAVYMDLAALNRMMGDSPVLSGLHLKTDPRQSGALYRALKETPAVAGSVLHTASLQTMRRLLTENLKMTMVNVLFACIIIFGVVYNSARITLAERGRELASLRVLGFTRFEVSYILLGELAILTLLALPLGCGLGYGFAWLMTDALANDLFRLPLTVERSTYGFAVVVVVLASAISGLVVQRRIGRLDLLAVLKARE